MVAVIIIVVVVGQIDLTSIDSVLFLQSFSCADDKQIMNVYLLPEPSTGVEDRSWK
jgi:hypothetical protein